MELDEGKKDLINREIRSFRDAHKVDTSGFLNSMKITQKQTKNNSLIITFFGKEKMTSKILQIISNGPN